MGVLRTVLFRSANIEKWASCGIGYIAGTELRSVGSDVIASAAKFSQPCRNLGQPKWS